jgi:hypothetical protein
MKLKCTIAKIQNNARGIEINSVIHNINLNIHAQFIYYLNNVFNNLF